MMAKFTRRVFISRIQLATQLFLGVFTILVPGTAWAEDTGVPGTVIDHSPKTSGIYIGSPSLAVLPDGTYVASHDEFGPGSTERTRARTRVFASYDRGATWQHISNVDGQFWSSLFVHNGSLYLIGTWSHYGNMVVRKSNDGGKTWTEPIDPQGGLIRTGQFHCAPVPIVVHAGRIWRAFEDTTNPKQWGLPFRARVISAPIDADLLQAESWTLSEPLVGDASWLEKRFNGFLEGNIVVTPDGKLVNILRVDCPEGGKAAVVTVSPDGTRLSFDPNTDFIDFPGGAKKFTIRFDPETKRYWSLVNAVPLKYRDRKAASVRNTLALTSSADLRHWTIHCALLHHPDPIFHGFQYPDWLFDGEDMIAVIRTAFDDEAGGAHNAHDANFLTFHRFRNFRSLSWPDSVLKPEDFGIVK